MAGNRTFHFFHWRRIRRGICRVLQLAPGTLFNLIEQKQGVPGNLTILLLDFLNTKHSDIAFAKDKVIKLLSDMKPSDRVAVYVLSGRLYVLHDFTSDMTALTQSVKKYDAVNSADVANSILLHSGLTRNNLATSHS